MALVRMKCLLRASRASTWKSRATFSMQRTCLQNSEKSLISKYVNTSVEAVDTTLTGKFLSRDDLKKAQRIVVKLGSAVLTRSDQGGVALGRLASVVEQVAELHSQGKEVMIVTSGAVAFGKQRLGRELLMSQSVRDTIRNGTKRSSNNFAGQQVDSKSCAAAGQSGLMSLYESMFAQYSITTAQVLVSKRDLDREHRMYLQATLDNLLDLSIVPIINTNDAVVPLPDPEIDVDGAITIKDNDSLAARLAVQTSTDLLILMSDVDGLFTAPPGTENSKFIHTYTLADNADSIEFGKKSSVGTGGMDSKVQAAVWSLKHGTSVVICNGFSRGMTILDIVDGRKVGTFFTDAQHESTDTTGQSRLAKDGSRKLQQLSEQERKDILFKMADLLEEKEQEIMSANHIDVANAKKSRNLSQALMDRLVLSPARLRELASGVRHVAEKSASLVGQVMSKRILANGLFAEQIRVPIGVLLIIFESRPDCLPQIASLAIATGNGVLLKGGSESINTNRCLHLIVQEALALHDSSEAAQLVEGRDKVSDLIHDAKGSIDLVIPRGSSEMVKGIQNMAAGTSVPVLGHSEGVCHVYVDRDCSVDIASRIVQDAKCNYPAACNAMETLLIHKDLIQTSLFKQINDVLLAEGVKIHLGPKLASRLMFTPSTAASLKKEYSALECTVEEVDGVEDAVRHIHEHGSSHTDTIVTHNEEKAEYFLKNVDSACVFHNASTRFADGQRLGLGAEVGVSTTRIHARGPVGAEGLLTYKWVLRGEGHIVRDFGAEGTLEFVHRDVRLDN